MKVLITGSNGQFGSEIRELAAKYKKLDFVFKDISRLGILIIMIGCNVFALEIIMNIITKCIPINNTK